MEDKFTVTVPSRYYAATFAASLAVNRPKGSFFGPGVSGAQAFNQNLHQFMLGSPVVDYNSISITLNGNPSATCRVEIIETSVTRADSVSRPSISTASAYSNFSNRLHQNRSAGDKSSAAGVYRIYLKTSSFFIQGDNLQGTNINLRDEANTGRLDAPYDACTDFYDDVGNFIFCVAIMDATGFSGTGGAGPNLDFVDVTIRQPEYTEAYNWAELSLTSRADPALNNSSHSVLLYDGGRADTFDPTDPLSDYDMQGISCIAWNAEILVIPVATLSANQTISGGAFWRADSYGNTGNAIFTSIDCGRSFNSAGNAANFNPNKFTMIRGNGYVRILGQVADMPSGTVNATYAERDDCVFFGMFKPYETMEEYPNPMAFLGKVGGSASRTGDNSVRPFWRTSTGTLTEPVDDVWALSARVSGMRTNGQFTARMPFILSRQFRIEASPSGTYNQPKYTKLFIANGSNTPLLDVIDANPGNAGGAHADNYQGVDNVGTISIGSTDDLRRAIATNFNTGREAVSWDPVIGYSNPSMAIGSYLSNPGGTPNIEPITFTQLAPDHHTWTYQDGTTLNGYEANQPTSLLLPAVPTGLASVAAYENIGELPGLYWGPEIEYYTSTGATVYPAGSEFVIKNRTYRMVIGHNGNTLAYFNVVDGLSSNNSGNLFFDLNPL